MLSGSRGRAYINRASQAKVAVAVQAVKRPGQVIKAEPHDRRR
jgi:hypothetical protein